MLQRLFNIELDESVTDVQLDVQNGWIVLVVVAVLALYGVWLYRSESWLSRGRRFVMGGCYILAGTLLALLLLEPTLKMKSTQPVKRTVLVLVDTSESMNITDDRQEASDVMEAAKVLGQVGLNESAANANLGALKENLGEVSRLAMAKAALAKPELSPEVKLGEDYKFAYYSLGERLEPISGEGEGLDWIQDQVATAGSSRIGSAIEEVVARHAGQPLAGVVVLSDFAWIEGRDPVQAARSLNNQVPVFTVPIGLPAPPDVEVQKVIAPEVAFSGDRVPVRVQIDSSGFDEKTVALTFKVGEEEAETREVTLKGGVQFEKFEYVPGNESGSVELAVSVEDVTGETTDANNADSHNIRVVNEKINVLYVEGMPRWEFRYLRWVLLRDPRLNVRFLMTQGDKHLAATSPRHLGAFPSKAEEILDIDLVILGDVSSRYFKPEQLQWMEDLVKKGGGSLLMLAGPVGSPSSYTETRIAEMLPVKLDSVRWRGMPSTVHPVVTAAGLESNVVSLGDTKEMTNRIWSSVRPMGFLPELAGPKPGATTLLSIPRDASDPTVYPLVAWQRYGTGKTMFVGSADLWRLRREVGETFHARFWGQAIQFLALSRLLGQNKQVHIETGSGEYGSGEHVDVFANVLTESFEPVEQPSYTVLLEKDGESGLPTELELIPVPASPGLYAGTVLAGDAGKYTLAARSADPSIANSAEFLVKNIPLEKRDTKARAEVADQIAALTGGQVLAPTELGTLGDLVNSEEVFTVTTKPPKSLWDIPAIFILLIILTGIEWFMRRRENLV